jgi:hypothetical protein
MSSPKSDLDGYRKICRFPIIRLPISYHFGSESQSSNPNLPFYDALVPQSRPGDGLRFARDRKSGLARLTLACHYAITRKDVFPIKRVGAAVVSPDGKWTVLPVTDPSHDESKTVSDLWIVSIDGTAAPRKLTNPKVAERRRVESGRAQDRVLRMARRWFDVADLRHEHCRGRRDRRAIGVSTSALSPHWRPDGRAIFFSTMTRLGTLTESPNEATDIL